MQAVARGELSSMSEIYENRHRALFRFFFRQTGRQAIAEDLVHEVFLRMIRYRHTYQTNDSDRERANHAFEAWMYRIARNTLADHARKHRLEVTPGDELEEVESGRPSAAETIAKKEDLALLYRALRALPEDKRELLILTRFQGLSYDQVARVVGCEPGTVKTRVFRTMKQLGEIFTDMQKEKAS
jgi:RNA polymerase sigma-70 factor (ECF subfamily)